MAAITNSNARKYRYLGQEDDDPSISSTDTSNVNILRELVKKQLTKCTSLKQLVEEQKEFIKATNEESITSNTSGLASCNDYKRLAEVMNLKELLSSCGLTGNEVQHLLNLNNTNSEAPHAWERRLKAIEDKLTVRLNQLHNKYSIPAPFNVHEYEKECRLIASTSNAEKLTSHSFVPAEHPINNIKNIAEELFPSSDKTSQNDNSSNKHQVGAKSRKRRFEGREGSGGTQNSEDHDNFGCVYLKEKPKSLWDMKNIPKIARTSEVTSNQIPEIPSKSQVIVIDSSKQIKDGGKVNQTKQFVLTLSPNELIPLDIIKTNKITLRELKGMDKFKNYTEGSPSVTLYIKNLSHNCSPKDLASLMGHFEKSNETRIQYRILNGRMKGQAFVTFPSKETASKALNLCNGYILHEKPIVIQFGKHGS